MEIFVRVVDAGSFSAAASQLGVGQPAVSKAVAQLEARLGVRLLLRSTRRFNLTDAGKTFYENARRAIEQVNQAELAARGDAGLSGTLRVSAAVCFSRIHLLPRLPEFLAMHPEIDIDVLMDDRMVNLVEEGVDLALRTGDLSDPSLTARKIGQGRRQVMGTAAYFKAQGVPKTPGDLLAHEAVILQRRGVTADEWTFRKGTVAARTKTRGRVKISSGEGMREAVLSNLGIAIVNEWLFTPEMASGLVRSVLDDWTLPSQDLWAAFPTGGLVSAKARAFVAFVERSMAGIEHPRLMRAWGMSDSPRVGLIADGPLLRLSFGTSEDIMNADRKLSVLITGGLTGIGRATAVAFARGGARVTVSGRKDDLGQTLVSELRVLGSGSRVRARRRSQRRRRARARRPGR